MNESADGAVDAFEKERALEAARTELQDRLLDVVVPEGTPEEFLELAKLEAFVDQLADPQAERHLLKAANVELNETMAATPHGIVQAYQRHKLTQRIYGAANDNRAPLEQTT